MWPGARRQNPQDVLGVIGNLRQVKSDGELLQDSDPATRQRRYPLGRVRGIFGWTFDDDQFVDAEFCQRGDVVDARVT